MKSTERLLLLLAATLSPSQTGAFSPIAPGQRIRPAATSRGADAVRRGADTRLYFFEGLGKAFEEDGPLGKGITVGKIQIALSANDRGRDSIFSVLENHARNPGNEPEELGDMCNEVCLGLLRRKDDWVAACSESDWFKGDDYGKAESLFNQWADREAAKFEKDYVPEVGSDSTSGGPTIAIVSIIVEIAGDATNFERAGYSITDTSAVLTSLASDCRVGDSECLNAVEVFWTPSEAEEVLTERETITDFPELIKF